MYHCFHNNLSDSFQINAPNQHIKISKRSCDTEDWRICRKCSFDITGI